MPLTPQDVVNKKFAQKLRGYDQDEVDSFLDEVEAELVRLLTDNASLQNRLAAPPAAAPAPVAVEAPPVAAVPLDAPIAPGEPQEAALRTLLMAQRTADQAIAEARAEADALLHEARGRSAQIDQELNARTARAMADLEERRADLEARIEDLKAFEREYRLRLKAYLESQLKDLDGRSGSDEAGSGVPAAARAAAIAPPAPAATPPAVATPAAPVAPPVFHKPEPAPPQAAAPAPAFVVEPEPSLPQVLPAEWSELHEGAEPYEPAGPPREAPAPTLRAVPPLSLEPEPVGPFTVVPPPVAVEQVDEGPEPPTET